MQHQAALRMSLRSPLAWSSSTQLPECLYAIAVGQLLARGEHITPGGHPIVMGAVVVPFRHGFPWEDVCGVPPGLQFLQPLGNPV